MLETSPTLHLICGKAASGKTTLSRQLGAQPGSVVISEDEWLSALFVDELVSLTDYVRCSTKLQKIMGSHIESLLNAGVSVVLDFPANTIKNRQWMKDVVAKTDADHKLHYLEVTDEVCKQRLRKRNVSGNHPFKVSDEQFDQLTKHFVPPAEDEGFNVVLHPAKEGLS